MFAKDVTESIADLPALENLARGASTGTERAWDEGSRPGAVARPGQRLPSPTCSFAKRAPPTTSQTRWRARTRRGAEAWRRLPVHSSTRPKMCGCRYSRTARFWLAASTSCWTVGTGCAFAPGQRSTGWKFNLRALRVLVGFWDRFNRSLEDTAWVQISSSRLFDSSSELGHTALNEHIPRIEGCSSSIR